MFADFSPNTTQPITICNSVACDQPVPNASNTGTGRFITHGGPGFIANGNAGTSGVFYTDAKARRVVAAGTPGALKQYVKPGLSAPLNPDIPGVECYDIQAFGRQFLCGDDDEIPSGGSQERESSLRAPN